MFRRFSSDCASAFACACSLVSGVSAQGLSSLEPVLVTATRTAQRLEDALPAATLISRRDIETLQATELIELLGRQAGVQFARAGGPGSQASLFLRGANSAQVLVLLDGVRLNTALGAAALGGISLDAVERIEIVRGNLSSLYGSEAIGGVVQIFTLGADRSGVQASAQAGAGEARAASFSVAHRGADSSLALTASARRAAPFSAIDPSRVIAGPFAAGATGDIDGHREASGALRAGARLGGIEVDASFWGSRSDTDFDSTADGPAASHAERSRRSALQLGARVPIGERWTARLAANQSHERTRNRSSEPFSFDNAEFAARNRGVGLHNEVQLAERVTATLGFERLQSRGESTAFDPSFSAVLTRFDRRVDSAQFGVAAAAGAQRVQINVRHDAYSDVGDASTGLLAYGHDLSSRWRLTAQLANAFRAPSFNDLHFPFFGNPRLAPERARSGELALRYAKDATSLRAGVFSTRTRDLIVFDAASGTVQNIARAAADGIELAASTRRGAWQLQGNASFVRARDRAGGERLLRRAPLTLNLAATRSVGAFDGGLEVSRVGHRFDSDINSFARKRLAGYTLARAFAGWRLTDALRLQLRVENLFDADYALVDGYNTPRRGAYAAVALRL